MKNKKVKNKKAPKFLSVFIVALIGLGACLALIAFLAVSVSNDIANLNAAIDRLNAIHENSETDMPLAVEYYRELSSKTDAAINTILMVVSIFTMIIVAFGAMLAFKTPRDIEKRMDKLNGLIDEAKEAAENAKCEAENAEYQAKILEAINVNLSSLDDKLTNATRLKQIASVIDKYPDKYEAYVERARILIEMCRKSKFSNDKREELLWRAIDDFKDARRYGHSIYKNYNGIGIVYDKLNQCDKAINFYAEAIKEKPDYADAYNNRANTYYDMKKYEEAIKDYNEAIKIDNDKAVYYNNRADAYYEKKKYEEAINDYDQTLRIDPDYNLDKEELEILREKVQQEKLEQARKEEQGEVVTAET
ncbi:MAG: tetratricopeptide repeat protein [Oscillospiraceae bacterium]|jgi:tetratricopeptide (TPR) repeat protein|nr:tetratricopeptide repeat protein [Oscillospiraceae bacterium]